MKKVKLTLIATAMVLCFACGNKTDTDFSIIPVKGTNGEYQYIDLAQKGLSELCQRSQKTCIIASAYIQQSC
ncbi:MAG: hypothetical protein LBC75_09790 [Fibromonadaceae bacterium]|nr:hypothetical protein [Fibromonadaceae bacterium]